MVEEGLTLTRRQASAVKSGVTAVQCIGQSSQAWHRQSVLGELRCVGLPCPASLLFSQLALALQHIRGRARALQTGGRLRRRQLSSAAAAAPDLLHLVVEQGAVDQGIVAGLQAPQRGVG